MPPNTVNKDPISKNGIKSDPVTGSTGIVVVGVDGGTVDVTTVDEVVMDSEGVLVVVDEDVVVAGSVVVVPGRVVVVGAVVEVTDVVVVVDVVMVASQHRIM